VFGSYDWAGRSVKYHRAQVRSALGFREATVGDEDKMAAWLAAEVCPVELREEQLRAAVAARCRGERIEPPAASRVERVLGAARAEADRVFCARTVGRLGDAVVARLEALAGDAGEAAGVLAELRADPGKVSLETLLRELDKLARVRAVGLSADLFDDASEKVVEAWRARATRMYPSDLVGTASAVRLTLLAALVSCRAREITDALVELIALVHKINTRAERRVEGELLDDLRRVRGKEGILFALAQAAVEHPDDTVRRALFPVMDAVGLLACWAHRDRVKFYDADEQVPLDGVVPAAWRTAVVDERGRVERIPYELCALTALRDVLRRREVWVVGAGRWRNPEADLPGDFELNRDVHYAALRQPTDPSAFLAELRAKLTGALERLDVALTNDTAGGVKITTRRGEPWISVPKLVALDEPRVLGDLKAEVARRWGTMHLLDVLKEADWLCGFTGEFTSVASREVTDRETLRRRLLLVLFALGTNMGVRAIVATGGHGETEAALRRVRRTHVTRDNLRRAVAAVVNETFTRRDPAWWGTGTACASDSKRFGSWESNLMTEWHAGYGGAGVMIYWHVERESVCVYSQLKSCSSSEVAAMIEGLLRNLAEPDVAPIDRNYTDTHGASVVGFAFLYLLGFKLLPRLKNIGAQRLYRADDAARYANLGEVLSRPIRWELIGQQYDQLIKYATALSLGTAEAEQVLRRFTRAG